MYKRSLAAENCRRPVLSLGRCVMRCRPLMAITAIAFAVVVFSDIGFANEASH